MNINPGSRFAFKERIASRPRLAIRSWCQAASALILLLLAITATATAAPRPPWTSSRVTGSPNPPAPYQIQRRYPKLTFSNPVDMALRPGTNQWFLLEQGGKLYSFADQPETDHADLVFDFRPHHQPFSQSLAFTFHPRFVENGYVFVCYTEPEARLEGSIVSRFTLRGTTPPTLDPASEKILLRWPTGSHNGCTLAFGNDGLLYISSGDSGNPDPPDDAFKTGQDISDLLACILRVDVDHDAGTNGYAIPPGNPFIKTPGARPEVYAFGLRNPWRMSFDRSTGDLWVGDVGWEQWEMIYRVQAGGNYGWSLVEGPNTHVRTDIKPGPGPILPPVIALPHSEAASIIGGRVYHGIKLPRLQGAYLYGDWETGTFWALRHENGKLASNTELCRTKIKVVSFAEDRDGELCILDYNGGIYGLAPQSGPPANLAFPRRLSETGLFSDLSALVPAPGVVPYTINAGMWNDYARAERLLAMPGTNPVVTADGRPTLAGRQWQFPSNTVFARTLILPGAPDSRSGVAAPAGPQAARSGVVGSGSSGGRRIETQLMHFDGQAWNPYIFRWNAAQTDADLVPAEGTNDVFTVADAAAPGGRRDLPWRFGSRADCFRCHNSWAGETLSFSWLQLNTPGATAEWERLEQLGVLRVKDAPKRPQRLADPYDETRLLAERARSWLHVNCAGCHRFGAGAGVPSQFAYDQPVEKSRALDAKPVRGDFGIAGARVIAPGDPYRSTLLYRISTEGLGHMPHLGSRLVDEPGVRLVRDWIRSLPPATETDAAVAASRQSAEQNARWLAQLNGEKRHEAVTKLLGNLSGCLALLCETTDPALRLEAATLASTHTNALVRDLFQRLLPPDQRRQTLGPDFDPQTVLTRAGNPVRGRELFLGGSQCSRCHICEGAGRAFGPDLTGIGRKYNRAQLLEQILFPSKVIAPEFKTTNLTLQDGGELSGFVTQRTADELVLRDADLADHRVKLSAVKTTQESNVSAMPEALLAPLTPQEAADLLEYLGTTNPPKK